MTKQSKPAPRTCATHNPGSPDCGPNCPDALRDPNATPGLVFAMADGSKVGAPADVARAQQMTAAILETPRNTPSSPEVGPESESEMDEAVDDIERRDDESDEVDTDIEGDDDEGDGPIEPTDEEQAYASLRDELRDENANLKLRIVELERANRELNRQLTVMRSRG